MSDSEDYEDFGSGDESWDELEEDIELDKADSVDAIENLNCLFLSSQLFKSKIEKEATSFASSRNISVSVAKTILMKSKWNTTTASQLLSKSKYGDKLVRSSKSHCDVCDERDKEVYSTSCNHKFCLDCWRYHTRTRLQQRLDVCCMHHNCEILLTETAVLPLVPGALGRKFEEILFDCMVLSYPGVRFCPGPDCGVIVMALEESSPKRVRCQSCSTEFCFQCGLDFHHPTECSTIKLWLQKCSEDSDTADYIATKTKDCPMCSSCIEKSGGCNHVICGLCKYEFCWVCSGDWKEHGAQYYECSRFKENPDAVRAELESDTRASLSKYLHYFQRWDNHSSSLKMEKNFQRNLQEIAASEVQKSNGTWIDWAHLKGAGKVLAQCRYTLKFTYPRAYFMETSKEKMLFEYQQGVLEADCEDLAWKLENARKFSVAELEQASAAAQKSRMTLVKSTSLM
ncbi:unnamed protein product [Oikopleura dioica]|uniref:RBR-type E3 ubiquitin transferase n=1 Tax=Oikopleura dioica TaxID=34765 RepID=E4WXQ7_OIKDI|nr:unnamed protein product [Oikopleura dioica]